MRCDRSDTQRETSFLQAGVQRDSSQKVGLPAGRPAGFSAVGGIHPELSSRAIEHAPGTLSLGGKVAMYVSFGTKSILDMINSMGVLNQRRVNDAMHASLGGRLHYRMSL